MRLHVGFIKDPAAARGPGSRSFPFRMRNPQRFAGRRSPGREIPHAPQTRSPRLQKHRKRGGRAGDRRIRWKEREASAIVRMRSSAAPDAHAHAGHASRTLFANATAAIFLRSISNADILYADISLRRICLCRYYVGYNAIAAILRRYSLLHIMTTVDITPVDILYCSYTHITYS